MAPVNGSRTAAYAAAVQDLTSRLHQALDEGRHSDPVLAASVRQAGQEQKEVLAAVRVLGPDALAPALLAGVRPHPHDREVLDEVLLVFPPAAGDPVEAACLAHAQQQAAQGCGSDAVGAVEAGDAAQRAFVVQSTAEADWCAWAQHMARLSPLAWPALPGPVADMARKREADVERGLTRAMLRRDYASAARLARWAALTQAPGGTGGLDPEPLLRHVTEMAGGAARVLLDAAIARRLLAGRQAQR